MLENVVDSMNKLPKGRVVEVLSEIYFRPEDHGVKPIDFCPANKINATIVALAWPDTKVVHEGKWYDVPMKWIGLLKNGYYKAGHAAFLLINHKDGEVLYFDFGRYHTPLKFGRVRDKHTDPDISINIRADIENEEIHNLDEILIERYYKKACHGKGRLTASIVKNIDFNKAYEKVKQMQNREAIPYGPFEWNGTNCSRLVGQIVYVSTKNLLTKLLIKIPYTVSASPRSNAKILNDCPYFYEVNDGEIFKMKSKFYFFKKVFNWSFWSPRKLDKITSVDKVLKIPINA